MSYCSRSCRRWFILSKVQHFVVFAATVSNILLRICRNGHLGNSGKSSGDFTKFSVDFFCILYAWYHSLPDPDFLAKCEILAIWRRLPLIVAFYKLKVCRISNSGLFYLLRQVWSWYGHPLPSYCVLAADTLREISRVRRNETPKPIWIQFWRGGRYLRHEHYTNFGDHRLRDFWVARGQISPVPIDFYRRPYNTLALPCD